MLRKVNRVVVIRSHLAQHASPRNKHLDKKCQKRSDERQNCPAKKPEETFFTETELEGTGARNAATPTGLTDGSSRRSRAPTRR
jgi:hypothetical protein